MSLKDKTNRLFEYISQVYSIDLPVDRDMMKYKPELWWQAELKSALNCKIKQFDSGFDRAEPDNQPETLEGDKWLSVTKLQYDNPPELPSLLKEWRKLPCQVDSFKVEFPALF